MIVALNETGIAIRWKEPARVPGTRPITVVLVKQEKCHWVKEAGYVIHKNSTL